MRARLCGIALDSAARESIFAAARDAAAAAPPQEMAGVMRGGKFIPMPNLAADPTRHFAIDRAVLDDGIDAVVHSHPGGPPCPSAEDMAQQQACDLPWLIAVVSGETKSSDDERANDSANYPANYMEEIFAFDGKPDLILDEGYRHGVRDCYSLIRGFYARHRNVILPDYPRNWGWWHDGGDLYEEYFAHAGFTRLAGDAMPRAGDVFLAAIRSGVANHGGVLLEDGLILHHLAGNRPADAQRLPRKEPVGRWQKHITHWLRYNGNHGDTRNTRSNAK